MPHYAKHSLMRRFLALILAISLLMVLAFAAMLFYVRDYSLRSSTQVMNNMLHQAESRIQEYDRVIENAAYTLCYSPTIQGYLQAGSITERIDMADSIRSIHSGTFLAVDSLIGIAAFDADGSYITSSQSNLYSLDGLPEIYRQVKGYVYTGLFPSGSLSGLNKTGFAMLTPVYAFGETSRLLGSRIGTVVFTFDTLHLATILAGSTKEQGYHLVLTDADGRLMAASDAAAAAYYESRLWENAHPAAQITIGLEKGGWQLHGYLPQGVIASASIPLFVVIAITGTIFIVMLLMLILMMRRQILQPISKLSGFMARVPTDQQPRRFKAEADNELGQMIHVMNRMLDELDLKGEQLRRSEAHAYEAEISRKNMEVLAYRNQINPHFLYNTLDCICAMALYHGADEIADVSESLSTMFRYAVKGDSFATVHQEVQYVQEYASIIGARFSGRIRIAISAPEETLPCRTIKLLLQPLVENAVFHGLEKQVGPGNVQVDIRLMPDESLSIRVQDDGVGIAGDTLAALRESIHLAQTDAPAAPGTEKGIGLANIARRIHLYYGPRGSLEINSQAGQGTCVILTLPLLEGEEPCIGL